MSNNSLLLVDPDFKTDAAANCELLLKITNDSFSYAVLDQDSEQVKVIFDLQGLEDVHHILRDAFSADQYLSRSYGSVKAAIHTSNFVFIPNEWFNAKDLSIYASFLGSDAKVYTKKHHHLGLHTIFSFEEDVEQKLPENTTIYPQSSPLLALADQFAGDALLIDFTASSFNVLFIKDKKINFQNHYSAETAEEFNYFLLLIMEQLVLTESCPVYLQGIINEDDDYYNILLKYFNNLYFFLPVENKNCELLADMPKHYFSGLLALSLCE